jgi:hypothetical protein
VTTPPAGGYSVFLIAAGDSLGAHAAPDLLSPVVADFPSDAVGLAATGRAQHSLLMDWTELELPTGGTGWVNRLYLTETVGADALCADARLPALLDDLRVAVDTQNGSMLESIVSAPHGFSLTLLHGGRTRTYLHAEVFGLFAGADVEDWGLAPASGLPVMGSFGEKVQPDLQAVLDSPFDPYCDSIHLGGASYQVEWPYAWHAAHPVSLFRPAVAGDRLDWMTWVAGIEYVDGAPRLFSLSRYAWEP